jgi:hypothetical protein
MLVPLFAPAIFLCVAPVPVMVFIFFGPPASTTKKIVIYNTVKSWIRIHNTELINEAKNS